MKKITALSIAIVLIAALLCISTEALAYNPAGHCSTVATVKEADPSAVVKDGVIGEGEYTEIEIDRNVDTTDCLLGWDNPNGVFEDSEKFLANVHYYMSWDKEHGLNIAVKAQLLEDTPSNLCYQPDDTYGGWGFPGDEFLFQFGMAFSIIEPTGNIDKNGDPEYEEIIQRGISKNTETGHLLIGHYGEWGYGLRHIKTNVNGYTGALTLTPETDYNVGIVGNTITYEMSFPLANIMSAEKYNGNTPVEGASVFFNCSTTGGSTGLFHSTGGANGATSTYGVALGDYGMFLSRAGCDVLTPATAVFSLQNVVESTDDNQGDKEDVDNNVNDGVKDDYSKGTEIDEPVDEKDEDSNNSSGYSTKTGDVAVVLAVVSVLSAGGIMLGKKRK